MLTKFTVQRVEHWLSAVAGKFGLVLLNPKYSNYFIEQSYLLNFELLTRIKQKIQSQLITIFKKSSRINFGLEMISLLEIL